MLPEAADACWDLASVSGTAARIQEVAVAQVHSGLDLEAAVQIQGFEASHWRICSSPKGQGQADYPKLGRL